MKANSEQDLTTSEKEQNKDKRTVQTVTKICKELMELTRKLEGRHQQLLEHDDLTYLLGDRLMLEDVMEYLYEYLRQLIPYDRIGLATIDIDDNELLEVRWVKNESNNLKLGIGYTYRLPGSTLENVIKSGKPRIINDLAAYLTEHAASETTRLLVEEGIRSSLSFPLRTAVKDVGFIFFSSFKKNAYDNDHITLFHQFSDLLSQVIEMANHVAEDAKNRTLHLMDTHLFGERSGRSQ